MYKQALQAQLRYPSTRGKLTTEDLFSVSLCGEFSLDSIAQTIDAELSKATTKSFVKPAATSATADLTLALNIVKDVIAIKLAAETAATNSAANAARKKQILAILASKRDDADNNKTEEQLLVELEALNV